MTTPDPEPSEPESKKIEASVHRCERCQRYFRVDDDVDRGYALKLWLCPPCHEHLLDEHRIEERTALEGAPWSSHN